MSSVFSSPPSDAAAGRFECVVRRAARRRFEWIADLARADPPAPSIPRSTGRA